MYKYSHILYKGKAHNIALSIITKFTHKFPQKL